MLYQLPTIKLAELKGLNTLNYFNLATTTGYVEILLKQQKYFVNNNKHGSHAQPRQGNFPLCLALSSIRVDMAKAEQPGRRGTNREVGPKGIAPVANRCHPA
jgi:hypothetical protein